MTKVTMKEDGKPKSRRRKSANKEDDNEGSRQSANKEGNATATIIQQGRQRQMGAATTKVNGKNKKGENQATLLAA